MSGSGSHGTGSGFYSGFCLEYDLPLGRGTPRILSKIVQSMFNWFYLTLRQCIAKEKEIIPNERKTEEDKGKYAGKAVDKTRVGVELVNTEKTWFPNEKKNTLLYYRKLYSTTENFTLLQKTLLHVKYFFCKI